MLLCVKELWTLKISWINYKTSWDCSSSEWIKISTHLQSRINMATTDLRIVIGITILYDRLRSNYELLRTKESSRESIGIYGTGWGETPFSLLNKGKTPVRKLTISLPPFCFSNFQRRIFRSKSWMTKSVLWTHISHIICTFFLNKALDTGYMGWKIWEKREK